jgi:hypothetical protein
MAIAAIDSQPGNVMLVTERNRLATGNVNVCCVRREVDRIHESPKTEEPEKCSQQREARDAVAALSKNLSHVRTAEARSGERHNFL